ncbi:hypothetical protein GCM10027184_07890 [Saccharothrix stipae]
MPKFVTSVRLAADAVGGATVVSTVPTNPTTARVAHSIAFLSFIGQLPPRQGKGGERARAALRPTSVSGSETFTSVC